MRRSAAAGLALCLLLTACGGTGSRLADPETERLLSVQLGALDDKISGRERAKARSLLSEVQERKAARTAQGVWEKSDEEWAGLEALTAYYDELTAKYLGDGEDVGDWGYEDPPQRTLTVYQVLDGTDLRALHSRERTAAERSNDQIMWSGMLDLLPEGAFQAFDRFTVFTDGPDEMVAYVQMTDWDGTRWEIALDPEDTGDDDWTRETIVHEYGHYLALNADQVDYSGETRTETYCEEGMTARPGSYLDTFYRMFWTDLLDDRLADMDSYGFLLRHPDDFVTEYAATDPVEDLAESFACYVLYDAPPETETAVWAQKWRFFDRWPDLAEFRAQVQERLASHAVGEAQS